MNIHRLVDSGDAMASRTIEIMTKLGPDELRAMACRESDRRAAMRILAIANELDGYERDEAARLAGMSDQALRDAIKRFNAEGLDGLGDRPRSGRPRRLDAAQEAKIKAAVLAGPDIEKDGLSAFTLEDIRRMIEEQYGASYHIGYMGRLMQRLGLSRQKARPSHPKKDEAAAAAFKKGRTQAEENCSYTRAPR
jgi:transposase